MANVELTIDSAAVRDLLRSQEMMAICEEKANKALATLGSGYTVTTMTGKNRVNASIFAETYEAKRDNLKNNSILKALR